MHHNKISYFISVVVLGTFLAGCSEEAAPIQEQIRAVKTITISEVASGQLRKYSGIVEATDTARLSFQVGGNIAEILVELGDRVKQGDVIAKLDRREYDLNVQAATANLEKAQAEREEARLEFDRKDTLYQQKWVAKAAYDQALASYESTKSSEQFTMSQLNLAKRDLSKTVLIAPFDGTIAARDADAFQEVQAGEPVFEINADGALQVAIEVSETTIASLNIGAPVDVSLATHPGELVDGRITEIGSVAGVANAFPVKASLINPPEDVRAGMTAELTINLKTGEESAFLVPLAAIAPGEETRQGYVFKFDPESSTLKRIEIRGAGVRDNLVMVRTGVNAGDVIVVAGVSFLHDGQKVKLLNQ